MVKKIYGPAYSGKKIFVLEYFLTLCICKDRKNCRDNVIAHKGRSKEKASDTKNCLKILCSSKNIAFVDLI